VVSRALISRSSCLGLAAGVECGVDGQSGAGGGRGDGVEDDFVTGQGTALPVHRDVREPRTGRPAPGPHPRAPLTAARIAARPSAAIARRTPLARTHLRCGGRPRRQGRDAQATLRRPPSPAHRPTRRYPPGQPPCRRNERESQGRSPGPASARPTESELPAASRPPACQRSGGIRTGLYRRRHRGCTVRDPNGDPFPDLVNRDFIADAPNRLWLTDITEHPTREGKCNAPR
jgi:hypothetical protein